MWTCDFYVWARLASKPNQEREKEEEGEERFICNVFVICTQIHIGLKAQIFIVICHNSKAIKG